MTKIVLLKDPYFWHSAKGVELLPGVVELFVVIGIFRGASHVEFVIDAQELRISEVIDGERYEWPSCPKEVSDRGFSHILNTLEFSDGKPATSVHHIKFPGGCAKIDCKYHFVPEPYLSISIIDSKFDPKILEPILDDFFREESTVK